MPAPVLQKYIKYYWVMESSGNEAHTHVMVYPEGYPELFFHYGDSFDYVTGNGSICRQPQNFLCCQKTVTTTVSTNGLTGVVAVAFRSFGASAFFRFGLHEFKNEKIDLCDILGDKHKATADLICNARSVAERIGIIEGLLHKLLNVREREMNIIRAGLSELNATPCRVSVEKAAESAFLSYRQFERIFTRSVGVSPREYIKIRKINYAIGLMKSRAKLNLTNIALDAGFYDQAHFINSFKSIISITPLEFNKMLKA